MNHAIFDTEIIGTHHPVFLLCIKIIETQQTYSFWHHKKNDLNKFLALAARTDLTWIGFNSINFDIPLLTAWVNGHSVQTIKELSNKIVKDRMRSWDIYKLLGVKPLEFDQIDLIEVTPGVMTSLKTYAGRMHYPTMVDIPFHHDQDLTPRECKVLEKYCLNDLGITEALFKDRREQIDLRIKMSEEYGMDLRSKSDAQIGEAVLKKKASIGRSANHPREVWYTAPDIINTKNDDIYDLIIKLEKDTFRINQLNGAPIEPEWMEEPMSFRNGLYKVGLGGLHSQHDQSVCYEANDEWEISDIDAASYYPSIILQCGLVPNMSGNKGDAFLTAYSDIYHQRITAKRAGNKVINEALKIVLNGSFGKLGSQYCCFYSPDLLLAVTLTGQLNLLTLIDDLVKPRSGIEVISANTDGIMIRYKRSTRDKMLRTVARHGKRTGFEYEETRYRKVAIKDVNNYIAIKLDGGVKAKGLYAPAGIREIKNPTAEICSMAAAEYLKDGTRPENFIDGVTDIRPFITIRNVNIPGGGIQHEKVELVDDWVLVEDRLWQNGAGKRVKRVSKPPAYEVGTGGKPFGRIARWYMTTKDMPPITQVSNGNQVAKTEGARLCMTLPDTLPDDLDKQWYIDETYSMLKDMGVNA